MIYRRLEYPATILLSLLALSGCGGNDGDTGPLTWTVDRRDLVSSVTAEGEVQAVRSHVLVAPRMRGMRQLEIARLAPEGSYLERGDVAVEYGSAPPG